MVPYTNKMLHLNSTVLQTSNFHKIIFKYPLKREYRLQNNFVLKIRDGNSYRKELHEHPAIWPFPLWISTALGTNNALSVRGTISHR